MSAVLLLWPSQTLKSDSCLVIQMTWQFKQFHLDAYGTCHGTFMELILSRCQTDKHRSGRPINAAVESLNERSVSEAALFFRNIGMYKANIANACRKVLRILASILKTHAMYTLGGVKSV